MIDKPNPDRDLIPSVFRDSYCQFKPELAVKTPYYHIYRQVERKSQPTELLDIKVLNTQSNEYKANPSIVTTIFLNEALRHQHCKCCRYTNDECVGSSSEPTVKDIQYEIVERQYGDKRLLKLGIVTQSSYPVRNSSQQADPKLLASISVDIDIEKMILDIGAELNDLPCLQDQKSSELRRMLNNTQSVRFYKVQRGGRVADRYFIDNWIDVAVSSSEIEELSLLTSNVSESQSLKGDDRMFELGLLSLKVAGVDEYPVNKLTGTISSRGSFDIPTMIKESLDRTSLSEVTKDLIRRTIAIDSPYRVNLNQATRSYSQRRTQAKTAMNMVDNAIKKYYDSNQSPTVKRDVDEAWKRNSALILEEVKRGNSQGLWIKGVLYHFGISVEVDYKEAMRLYRLAAGAGNANAQNNLGYMYDHGQGVEVDYKEAVRLYRLAADAGQNNAQNNLGYMYQCGQGVEVDYKEAVRLYLLVADSGHDNAQSNLGYMYENGQGVEVDYKEAARRYRLAADAGDISAQTKLGSMYDHGQGVEVDYKEAARRYRLAADAGNSSAQNNLGYMYENGKGVEKDYKEAVRLYRLAADAGNSSAQSNLGYMYQCGQGVEVDYKEAMRLFRLAADAGNSSAQSNLGYMYQVGWLCEKNSEEAVRLYRLAADAGDADAQNKLGIMYQNGDGVEVDYKEAVRLYRLAAKAGWANALSNLGLMYNKGLGVEKDSKEAKRLFRLAFDAGDLAAQHYI